MAKMHLSGFSWKPYTHTLPYFFLQIGLKLIFNLFSNNKQKQEQNQEQFSMTSIHSATLTPMHLRKAKLMFFWVRYPSSAVLKMYFPDIKFNKNNTAQLVKWFSNFRWVFFFRLQMLSHLSLSNTGGNFWNFNINACHIINCLPK